jgi:hypothetical protein
VSLVSFVLIQSRYEDVKRLSSTTLSDP